MNCICTLYDQNFSGFIDPVLKSLSRFVKLNPRFELVVFRDLIDSTRSASWNKLLAIQECFDRGYEWVFWADADSLFIGTQALLFVPKSDLTVSTDSNGICCSHMLVGNTIYNRRLLEMLYFLETLPIPKPLALPRVAGSKTRSRRSGFTLKFQ